MLACTRGSMALILVATAASLTAQPSILSRYRVDSARYLSHVKALAADELGGRGNGAPGLDRAAEYIATEFKKARLTGGGDQRSYLQRVNLGAAADVGAGTLILTTPDDRVVFHIGTHYYPLSTPVAAAAAGSRLDVVFAGYGIVAPALGYDDYAGLDVAGKAVVVLTHEPQELDPESVLEGRALTPHSDITQKAAHAASRGAHLLLVVEDPNHVTDRALTRDWGRDPQIDRYDLPVVRIDRTRLDRALESLDLERTAREIDRTLQPASRQMPAATVTLVDPWTAPGDWVSNVVGVLEGTEAAPAREAIVIGAHYDHLGYGGRYSEDRGAIGQIHNGADDNASGTAAVIEMAHTLARQRVRFRRTIVFAAFAGEELGLLGSRQFVTRYPAGVRRIAAMINLDMVGRAGGRVMIRGGERAPFLTPMRALRPLAPLAIADFRDGYGAEGSDDAPFAQQRIPTLAFFTGFHDDYHRPSDDWERIDARGAAQIAQFALAIAARIAGE
jgi:hypothetical protein